MGEELIREIIAAQRETNRWLRVLAWPVLAEVLRKTLRTPEEMRVYRESDGRTSRDVGAASGVSHTTVHNYWRRWAPAGIVEPAGVEGRYRHLVDLADVGIEVEERDRA
jgi:hypothetical protein